MGSSASESEGESGGSSSSSGFSRNCGVCGVGIEGSTYMFNDKSFCCQRHRLNAVYAMERQTGQHGGSRSNSFSSSFSSKSGKREPAAPTKHSTDTGRVYYTWL